MAIQREAQSVELRKAIIEKSLAGSGLVCNRVSWIRLARLSQVARVETMKPRLIPEWRAVLNKAWSVKFSLLAGLLGCAAEVALPIFSDSIPRGVFGFGFGACCVAHSVDPRSGAKDDS